MPVKFNQYWTVDWDKTAEYEKFIINKFIPGINRAGIHTVAAWTVLVGGYSEIFFEGISNDLDQLEKALINKKYKELNAELQNYVTQYKSKVMVSTGIKEAYSSDIRENTVKFNQTWDVISHKRADYKKFVTESYYPLMEQLDISIASEWEVLIGDGPRIICEGRAQDINSLLGHLQSKQFQKARRDLKSYVYHYENRILVFHIIKILGYKSASYRLISS
jgi:hypothetical protein